MSQVTRANRYQQLEQLADQLSKESCKGSYNGVPTLDVNGARQFKKGFQAAVDTLLPMLETAEDHIDTLTEENFE